MPLPAPELDDRRFQDLVDETKRLIPRYCPEWTNHNLSDPGVALIELFAWMSEMVLFRLNQVPDRLYTKFLDLVGIQPFPPSVARADLTFWLSTVRDQPVVVPAGTVVATAGDAGTGGTVAFTTVEDLVVAPLEPVAAKTAAAVSEERYTDVWDDLRFDGTDVACFTSEHPAPGDAFYVGFGGSLAGAMLRLSIAAEIQGIGVDPRDPPLSWEAWTGETWATLQVRNDTTGGLNRDGDVELRMPRRSEPITLGGTRAHWVRVRLLASRDGQAGYQASPRIRRLHADVLGGTVAAEHAVAVGPEHAGRSDASPGQTFTLLHTPVLPRRDGEEVRVVTAEGSEVWSEVPDFTASGPSDRHYTIDDASGTVAFGPAVRYPDGSVRQHGAIPPDGAEIVIDRYRQGGGAAGNVGAGTLSVLRTTIAYVDRVSNLDPASGGVDGETPANAKLRGPLSLRTGQRAVTVRDFERLTMEASSEVARVKCLVPRQVIDPVRLLVVPQLTTRPDERQLDDFALPDALVDAITVHLDPRRLLGTTVDISTPFYQGISVAALVQALPGRPAALVRQRALDLLYRYLDPLVGGNTDDGWPFDADLNASSLAELLQALEGVERVEEVLLFEYDLRTGVRHGTGRELVHLDRESLFLSARHHVVVR
ncbi:MAG TPA: putative baseplate assembly protein [Acidimicrobiales bacterium]|nr:putative baseplate assembly protein [Acidimicrobiales bacterium]